MIFSLTVQHKPSIKFWDFLAWFRDFFHAICAAKSALFLLTIARLSALVFDCFSSILCISHSGRIRTKKAVSSVKKRFTKILAAIEKEMIEEDVAYVRVSNREQAEDTNALAQQEERLIAAGACYLFKDIQTGKKDKRPEFQRLLALVKRGKIRKVYITRIDRISRSLRTLKELVSIFEEYGTSLVILDQKIDMSTAQGKLLFNVLGALAEWEVDLLSERVRHGKKYQRNQQWANGQCPWGYRVIDHRYVLDHTPFLCRLADRPENYSELSQLPDSDIDQLPGQTIAQLARDCIDIFFELRGVARAQSDF